MFYRYNTIDIVVGVGLCAIVFGAVLFVVAANGTYQAAMPQAISSEGSADSQFGMIWLQPALGQAIVDQAIFERRAHQALAHSASEWNRATLAHHELQSLPGGPLGAVKRQAATIPADHMARVQGVMGRAIVSFTRRGVRSGLLSAAQYRSDFNTRMIRATEARGRRLHDEFASTWQETLGRGIVEAIRNYRERAGAIQERIGTALVHVTQAQMETEAMRAAHQEQLAGLIVAAVRTEALADRLTLLAAIESLEEEPAVSFTEPATWPEVPMGYVIAACFMLAVVFGGGLGMAVQGRESKARAESERNADKWVYRLAA